jgi:H/ACA ribonucleoprotein complex subunit 2
VSAEAHQSSFIIDRQDPSILVLAADITPIDIISHLPVMCEDAKIPYVFVPSKEELGHASATKRPTSCVMICPDLKKKPKPKDGKPSDVTKDLPDDEFKDLYAECFKEVQSLDQRVLF